MERSVDEGRLPPLPEDAYSPGQRAARDDFVALRKAGLSGPWHAFMRSPDFFVHAQRMGEYLRYRSAFAGRLAELATLLVAREWTQDFEFAVHSQTGAAAGLSAQTISAIRDGRRPEALDADAQTVVDFVTELMRRKSVSDSTWARALARFGEQGCVDLSGLVGYYGLLAAVMNAARTPPPPGGERLPRFPD
jgi:4-carboxymuconolactone decarboxylase